MKRHNWLRATKRAWLPEKQRDLGLRGWRRHSSSFSSIFLSPKIVSFLYFEALLVMEG